MTWVSYDWRYLCSSPRRLAITLRALPREPLTGLLQLTVCYASHLDSPEQIYGLDKALEKHAPGWLRFRTFNLSNLHRHLPAPLETYWANNKARWALGMKLLMPYVDPETPYLYTDDDVLITRDPQHLMTNSFGSKGCFRFDGRKQGIASELFDTFDLPEQFIVGMVNGQEAGRQEVPAWQRYDRAALDAGVWFHKYPDDWSSRLIKFAFMPYLRDLTTRNLELRCLDQRFLTCFGLKHGWTPITIGNGFAPPRLVTGNMLQRHPFFHYKSSSKDAWMDRLEAYLNER